MIRLSKHLRRFKKKDDGAALVEFALTLPPLLLAFFVVVEFSRLFFNYQAAVQGVRDATRYMARTTAETVCVGATEPTPDFGADEKTSTDAGYYRIVFRNMETEIDNLLPSNVSLLAVRSRTLCISGDFREPVVPVAELEADFEIIFPLVGILQLNNQPLIDPIRRTVNDQSRIYGI